MYCNALVYFLAYNREGILVEQIHIRKIPFKLQDDDTLVFLHIPKTAGTTFSSILYPQFSYDRIHPIPTPFETIPASDTQVPYQHFDDFSQIQKRFVPQDAQGRAYHLVSGHYDYDLIQQYPQFLPVTFLRHPIEHLVSNFYHLKTHNDSWILETHKVYANLSLDSWAQNDNLLSPYKNMQTYWMTGYMFNRQSFTGDDIQLLRLAKENLSRCVFVGLQERFDDALLLLAFTLSWSPLIYQHHLNVSRAPERGQALRDETYQALLKASELDMQLYEFGKRLYNHRLAYMIETIFFGQSNRDFFWHPPFDEVYDIDAMYAKRIFESDMRTQIQDFIRWNAIS